MGDWKLAEQELQFARSRLDWLAAYAPVQEADARGDVEEAVVATEAALEKLEEAWPDDQ